jgi:protein Mpv17
MKDINPSKCVTISDDCEASIFDCLDVAYSPREYPKELKYSRRLFSYVYLASSLSLELQMISLRELFYLWVILLSYNTEAFSHPLRNSNSCRVFTAPLPTSFLRSMTNVMCLRGGQQKCLQNSSASIHVDERERIDSASENAGRPLLHSSIALIPFTTLLHSVGKSYSRLLQQYPIGTKSMTACCIFAMSDLFAQSLEKDRNIDQNNLPRRGIIWSRVLSSAAVGLLYFGPAAHYWYSWIFRILPAANLQSTLQKALLGQIFFGPTFTCIFFASSLIQSGTFTVPNWLRKIRTDLPSAWLAGAGFWPIIDVISYSFIAPQWIPLFINVCSLFWTTYLVLKSYSN